MQRLLPPPRETGRVRTCSQSDPEAKNSASALLGQTLAGCYKILKVIDARTFKGHDLVLDQTVNVREELRAPGTDDVLRRFDRDTQFVAAGLLSAMSCAALLIIASMPESRYDIREASKPKSDLAASAEAAVPFKTAPKAEKSASLEMALNTDQKFAEVSAKEDPPGAPPDTSYRPVETPGSNSSSPRAPSSQNPIDAQITITQREPVEELAEPKSKPLRHRTSTHRKLADLKTRLLMLWHASLIRAARKHSDGFNDYHWRAN
jgi:hypothetical protein